VLNMPFKYNLPNANSVNNSISIFNRKVKKLIKSCPHAKVIEIDNNRKLFTHHGLHRNELGKRLVTYLLASFVQSHFEQKVITVITMNWHKEWQENGNFERKDKIEKAPTRNSNQNRKYLSLDLRICYGKSKCKTII
jgi:hypothetical protein